MFSDAVDVEEVVHNEERSAASADGLFQPTGRKECVVQYRPNQAQRHRPSLFPSGAEGLAAGPLIMRPICQRAKYAVLLPSPSRRPLGS
ncbi:hypothetical protein VTO73DRAFT_10598 [Trametes versicolor]